MNTTVPEKQKKIISKKEWRAKYLKVIREHNDLVRARYSLTLTQQRILIALYSMIEIGDGKREYRMSVSTLAELVGTSSKDYYGDIRDALTELKKHVLRIKHDRGELMAGWFDTADYIEDKGIVIFEISEKLKPYLVHLQPRDGHYTSYLLSDVLQLRSVYSIRLYQILRSYKSKGEWFVSLDDFIEQVGIRERDQKGNIVKDKLKTFGNINLRAIQPALREINEKSNLKVSCAFNKEGRQVVGLNFAISMKPLKDPWTSIPEEIVKAVPVKERNHKVVALSIIDALETKVANGILTVANVANMCRYASAMRPESYVRYLKSLFNDPVHPGHDFAGDGTPIDRRESYMLGRTILIDGKEYKVGKEGVKGVELDIPMYKLRAMLHSGEAKDVTDSEYAMSTA
jgi:plasmid replication initiation protein